MGIVSATPGVNVVWTEYDELKIRPDDARLIAAAPDLLAALKHIVNSWTAMDEDEQIAMNHARAVIAKAEGREVPA